MKIKTTYTFKKSEISQYFECQNPKLKAIHGSVLQTSLDIRRLRWFWNWGLQWIIKE